MLEVLLDKLLNPLVLVLGALGSCGCPGGPVSKPGVEEGLPIKISVGNEDDTVTRYSSRRSVPQVLDLEGHLGCVKHRNTLGISKSQNLVVIKDSVEVLNPNGVDRTIAANPVVGLVALGVLRLPDFGENARLPLADRVHHTEHLLTCDGLRIHLGNDVLVVVSDARESLSQRVENGGLTATSSADNHETVTHSRGLVELNDLEEELVLLHKVLLLEFEMNLLLFLNVIGPLDLISDHGEDITDELSEERLVLHDELGHVHLGERRGKEILLRLFATRLRGLTKHSTSETQDGQNVTETEIVVTLLGELLFAEFVKDSELLVEPVEIIVAD